MGAAIALRLAVRRPDGSGRSILARPAWVAAPAPDNMRPYALVGELIARLPADEAPPRFEASAPPRRRSPARRPTTSRASAASSAGEPAAFGRLLHAIAADGPGSTEARGRAASPSRRWSSGTAATSPIPSPSAEALAALIPGARLAVITPKAEDRAAYVARLPRRARRLPGALA